MLGVLTQQPFDLNTQPSQAVVRLPYLQNVQSDRATIMWAAQGEGKAYVEYTRQGKPVERVAASSRAVSRSGDAPSFTQYAAQLRRLAPNSVYSYRVIADQKEIGAEQSFQTAGSGAFRFVAFGDSGQNTMAQSRIASRLTLEPAALVIHTGDIAYYQGTFGEFQRNYFDYYARAMARVPFFTTPGNHDYGTGDLAAYLTVHTLPTDTVPASERGRYYSFDWNNVHFISLDSNLSLERAVSGDGGMLKWLERDLRSTRQFWRVAFFHHAPYAGGPYLRDQNSIRARQYLTPILEAHRVQVVLNGHEHSYQRTADVRAGSLAPAGTGTVYVTTGGGGADLYDVIPTPQVVSGASRNHYMTIDVDGPRMTLRAISDDGVQIDALTLSPAPSLSGDPATAVNVEQDSAGFLIRVRGWNLASQETFVGSPPFPDQLSGVTVRVNGKAIPLIYASGTEIYGEAPPSLASVFELAVVTPNGTVSTTVER